MSASRLTTRHRAGALLLALLAAAALALPLLAGQDPRVQDLTQVLQPPSFAHLLGTDHLGRDQAARLGGALRLSLGLALLATLAGMALGAGLGLGAAWRGGWTERAAVALADGVMALPGLLLVLLVAAFAPGEFAPLYAGLALALWVEPFRVVRAMAGTLLAGAPVEAARLLGFGPGYVLRHHLWPELAPVLGTLASFGVAGAVLAVSALGFVGVGLQPPTAELGLMMIELLPYWHEAPWLLAAPVAALVGTLAALVLLAGNGPAR